MNTHDPLLAMLDELRERLLQGPEDGMVERSRLLDRLLLSLPPVASRPVDIEHETRPAGNSRGDREPGQQRTSGPGHGGGGPSGPFAQVGITARPIAPVLERLSEGVQQRYDQVFFPLVSPGVEPQGDHRLGGFQLALDGAHQGRLSRAPVAEDADRKPWLALAGDRGERPGIFVELEHWPLGRRIEKDPVAIRLHAPRMAQPPAGI
jgi:hypothetical protein